MKSNVRFRVVKEWLEALLIACLIAMIMFFVCWPLRIDGTSMEKTFYSNDRVFMSRVLQYISPIKHGDIVLCKITEGDKEKAIIKRVIGTPGDYIRIIDGLLYVNDLNINEAYVEDGYTKGDINILLGNDEYFIMGDNRWVSLDSRELGAIKSDKLVGKVFLRFYPFDKIKEF